MLYENVYIESMGYVVPDNIITTAWIEEQLAPVYKDLGAPAGFIERLTGIKEHRWWDEEIQVSDASAMAGERAIENAAIDRGAIECLINASVCRDYIEPATASIVHDKLHLSPRALVFDVVNACLGFLNGMLIIANMIELGQIETGMVVAAEAPRVGQLATIERMLNSPPDKGALKDNLASFTLGAGSVAMILSHKDKVRNGHRIVGGVNYGNTEHSQLCVAQTTWMRTDSTKLLSEGTKVVVQAWKRFETEMGWSNGKINKLFTHQVSEPQRKVALRALGLPEDIDYPTLQWLGNTASVAAPISMAIAEDRGLIDAGDNVVLFGVGSGINSIVLGIEW
jgi:3-oxoacyl-[acyl-carrier-protein] synthase-3